MRWEGGDPPKRATGDGVFEHPKLHGWHQLLGHRERETERSGLVVSGWGCEVVIAWVGGGVRWWVGCVRW